ncbi:MAG: hypothetical protein KKB20_02760, partial [Proteobacteria bacterium]|nr:hypothetical protein [Pseudomonadota bacterium]
HRRQFEKKADSGATELVLNTQALDESWRVTLEVIKKLEREVRADGGRLALAVIPTITQVYDRYWELLRQQHPDADTRGWDRFRPQEILHDFARRQGILYIPLSQAMARAAKENGKTFYLDGDYHFNERGHQFVAETLFPVLESLADKLKPAPRD